MIAAWGCGGPGTTQLLLEDAAALELHKNAAWGCSGPGIHKNAARGAAMHV